MKPKIHTVFRRSRKYILSNGDCMDLLRGMPSEFCALTVTSPPYCIGKAYDTSTDIAAFIRQHEEVIPEIVRVTENGGSICWQVGTYVSNGSIEPLDYAVHRIFSEIPGLKLRNRIVWAFGHGAHCKRRFSGRYETVLWYTKGDDYYFDLDPVRVPQIYPGKRHYKGARKGEYSGNPQGKNPSDIWTDIPNVKANHVEKTDHPCQFPVALALRLIRALCPHKGVVLDPFSGTGTTGVAAVLEKRAFIGAEIEKSYYNISRKRMQEAINGAAMYRELERPLHVPSATQAVARTPAHFAFHSVRESK